MQLKYFIQFIVFFLLTVTLSAQVVQPHFPDSLFSTYYHQRVSHFSTLPKTKGDIIFLGNSITDGAEWSELFYDLKIKNRGISGDYSTGVLNRLDEIYDRQPDKVFLLIGINDLGRGIKPDSILKNIFWINALIQNRSPLTKVYVQSLFPVNEKFGKFIGQTSKKSEIKEINHQLLVSAEKNKYHFIDVFSYLIDSTGRLSETYTNDGLHLKGNGYLKWKEVINSLLYNLPALLPMPKKIVWSKEKFEIKKYSGIVFSNEACGEIAIGLQHYLESKSITLKRKTKLLPEENVIELSISDKKHWQHSDEGFEISVTKNKINLSAATTHGLFNALQTFKQLTVGNAIAGTEIADWPAFSWRGFMVDVGRNYQSIGQLKQQIDIMAAYKLNIFHFHLTEDIAWRIQSKKYPQLTDAKYMVRDPGKYYTLMELKELINYCKERFITLIPEIDMPGHSAAFKRAMGFDMQSEEGIMVCKNILRELCTELDVPYIHIGGDEVRISNKNFLPQMVDVVKSFNKKVIAWNPGGNVPEGTILQMWNGNTTSTNKFPSVDSRHLYLNHFDPIDGVVATFNHQICDVSQGDKNNLGATLCNWPDRKVAKEADLINMNAVYPIMISFAERCWKGGGYNNYLSDISIPGTERFKEFISFEKRLLAHKSVYFQQLSFPYVKQSDIEWKLVGPFDNKGKTDQVFDPETTTFFDTVSLKNAKSVYGGTIWLRHFWYPMIASHLQIQHDSTTYYAVRKIWSEEEAYKDFWIGFNNLSRSTATDSPPVGAWDEKNSSVWVNGKIILTPVWKRGGQKGDSEIPLTNEGYEYREPTSILLKKGWNNILIKAPVGSFKGAQWQNPIKWMFTFISL